MDSQFSSVAQSCLTLCNPINCSMPGLPVYHQLPEFTQIHIHRVSDAIQQSHPLSSPFSPALNPFHHQSLFQWVTADGDYIHEIKKKKTKPLLLGRKAMINLDSILKSRDISLPMKVHLVKAMVFPVVIYECEIWTVKKAEHQRIDAFELWCWRRLLRVPWTTRRSNQSILKEFSSGISLEGMMLKLKLQYFGHLMQSVNSLEKTLMLGGIGGWRR